MLKLISSNDILVTSGFRTIQRPDHTGIDIVSKARLELKQDVFNLAAADGKVVLTGKGGSVGNWVDILHEGKILTRYYHMQDNSIRVKIGQVVKENDILGIMGNTGDCSPKPTLQNPKGGTHLHFGIKENSTYYTNGTYVDPEPYLNGVKTIGKVNTPVATTTAKKTVINIGNRFIIKDTAKTYYKLDTVIKDKYKGFKFFHTALQVNDNAVLSEEVYSWIALTDITKI